jgi:hypothetical protein
MDEASVTQYITDRFDGIDLYEMAVSKDAKRAARG